MIPPGIHFVYYSSVNLKVGYNTILIYINILSSPPPLVFDRLNTTFYGVFYQ